MKVDIQVERAAEASTFNPVQDASESSGMKRAYSTPNLTVYGSVSALTSSGSMNAQETAPNVPSCGNNQPTQSKPCISSDARLKTNICKVGAHPFGFGLYTFRYRPEWLQFGSGRQFGVMADEVEPIVPAAVHVGEDGFKRVDYAMLEISLAQQ